MGLLPYFCMVGTSPAVSRFVSYCNSLYYKMAVNVPSPPFQA